jgi:hypothetical protein
MLLQKLRGFPQPHLQTIWAGFIHHTMKHLFKHQSSSWFTTIHRNLLYWPRNSYKKSKCALSRVVLQCVLSRPSLAMNPVAKYRRAGFQNTLLWVAWFNVFWAGFIHIQVPAFATWAPDTLLLVDEKDRADSRTPAQHARPEMWDAENPKSLFERTQVSLNSSILSLRKNQLR